MRAIKIINHFEIVDELGEGGGAWNVYAVTARMEDGSHRDGTCQGMGHLWSLETFEES